MNSNQNRPLKIYKASAGSGKTFRLAVEYIALLVKNPTDYQHILAVTFTNKATGEMKQRILSQLYGIANGIESSQSYVKSIIDLLLQEGATYTPEQVKEQCTIALSLIVHDYSNFRIVTIDSFFQSIVRELANELGLSANISAELNSDKVLEKAVDEIIDNLSTTSPEYNSLVRYIESRLDEESNWKVNDQLTTFGKSILKENYLIHDNSVRAYISDKTNLDNYRRNLEAFLESKKATLNQKINNAALYALGVLDNSSYKSDISSYPKSFLEKNWTEVTKWEKGMEEYITTPAKWLKKSKKEDSALLSYVETELIPLAESLKDCLTDRLKLENDVSAVKKHLYNLMIIGKIDEQMDRLNTENNRFLLAETAHFLRDVINESNIPFIYEKSGTTIEHIMIDEFQDTSTLQWENFKPLLMNCLDMGQSCLIVGDVKQSIYRFRNSDWKILNNMDSTDSELHDYISNIEQFTNFRSAPTVIEFNNRFFTNAKNIVNASYIQEHGHICYELDTAYSKVKQDPKDSEVYGYVNVENLLPTDEDKEEKKEKELQTILQKVKELIDEGVNQEDIAILVRKKSQASIICQYFESHKDIVNVDIISDETFMLEASSAVCLIISALRALSAQQDKLHLATIAYYYQYLVLGNEQITQNPAPIFLASEEELLTKYLPINYASERFAMRYKSIAEIVEEIYEMFNLRNIPNQDAYMFFFHDIIESYGKDNLADIDSFLRSWDDELHEKTIPNGNTKGVKLMTIHKSKGLEFHSVIMPYCNWDMEPSNSNLLWCSPTMNPYSSMPLLPIDYKDTKNSVAFTKDHDEEELLSLVDNINVLYVGFTRAIHNLIIITSSQKDSKKNTANKLIIDSITSAIKDIDNPYNMIVNETDNNASFTIGSIVNSSGPNISSSPKKKDSKENPLTRTYFKKDVTFVSNKTSAEFRQSNNSDLFISSMSDVASAQKHAEKIRLISIGNLYHNTLQLINTKEDIHSAILQMEKKGCFEQLAERDMIETRITSLVESAEIEHPEWFSHEWKAINERAILFADDNGDACSKRPDRVIVKGKKAIIIDYKTSTSAAVRLPNGDISVPTENREQVEEYCLKLKEIGFEEVEGYLWFILNDLIYKVQ